MADEKLKVFISWSGKRSRALAQALREWLPLVLQYVDPWVSDADISAGDRWAQAVANELEASNFGIICITPENISSEWVLFEAGALAKSMQDGKVIPLLFGLEFSDITGPLAQFQAKKIDENGMSEAIHAINNASGNKTSEENVKKLVQALWPNLEKLLSEIPDPEPSEKHTRTQNEILEELVTGFRGLDSRIREFGPETLEATPKFHRRKLNRFSPAMFEEITDMMLDQDDDPILLLIIAGLVREELPWMAEIVTELYREIKNGSSEELEKIGRRILRVTHSFSRGPLLHELTDGSKQAYMMSKELPRIIDRIVHRYLDYNQHHSRDHVMLMNED